MRISPASIESSNGYGVVRLQVDERPARDTRRERLVVERPSPAMLKRLGIRLRRLLARHDRAVDRELQQLVVDGELAVLDQEVPHDRQVRRRPCRRVRRRGVLERPVGAARTLPDAGTPAAG